METKGLIHLVQDIHLNVGQLMSQEVNDSPKITSSKKNWPLKVFFFFFICVFSLYCAGPKRIPLFSGPVS